MPFRHKQLGDTRGIVNAVPKLSKFYQQEVFLKKLFVVHGSAWLGESVT